jgi:putative Ca2+/H+ antiporter (TMEM165/GDT1 family)
VNLGLAAATFAVVIPAELPDKTFISAVVLSSRHRPLPVWLGAATGLVAGLFFAGAAFLFLAKGAAVESRGGEIARDEERLLTAGDDNSQAEVRPHRLSGARIAAITFVVVALAEFGDLTQVVIANLSARSRDPLSVFCGAALAFVVVSGVGVAAGRTITRVVPLDAVRKLSALVLVGLGVWSAVAAGTA